MIGDLNESRIEHLLRSEVVGRIGCHTQERAYVVPITYVYHEGSIYGHSGLGMKVEMMRAHPYVCFEVDHIENLANWQSVIAWGHYQELEGEAAREALHLLIGRLAPMTLSETGPPHVEDGHAGSTQHFLERSSRHGVVFRLVLDEKTGRYEKR